MSGSGSSQGQPAATMTARLSLVLTVLAVTLAGLIAHQLVLEHRTTAQTVPPVSRSVPAVAADGNHEASLGPILSDLQRRPATNTPQTAPINMAIDAVVVEAITAVGFASKPLQPPDRDSVIGDRLAPAAVGCVAGCGPPHLIMVCLLLMIAGAVLCQLRRPRLRQLFTQQWPAAQPLSPRRWRPSLTPLILVISRT